MTCFHPLDAARQIGAEGKPLIYKKGTRPAPLAPGWEPLSLGCGQCKGCRIDKSQEWAARMVHESQMHQDNCFVTLTYNAENYPYNGSLDKSHFQKFMKRLRKHYESQKIRYFHCGEYGERLSRPHYHACLFGIDFSDRIPYSSANDVITYTSETLETIWGKGFTTCGELNWNTAAYTSRYIMKKITGKQAKQHYLKTNEHTDEIHELKPEYVTMSLQPGIGKDFYEKYKTDFFPSDECPIPGRGVSKKVPRYYERLYGEEQPEALAKIKTKRAEYKEKHLENYTPYALTAGEIILDKKLSMLPRT